MLVATVVALVGNTGLVEAVVVVVTAVLVAADVLVAVIGAVLEEIVAIRTVDVEATASMGAVVETGREDVAST